MTTQKSFKRRVRTRMDKTGESYTGARAALLAAAQPPAVQAAPPTVSDAVIRRRTGHGWEHWFGVLDAWDAVDKPHGENARRLRETHDLDGWSAQAVTVSYERARGLRAVGEGPGGFTAGASKTVAVPVERLHAAFVNESVRRLWLPEATLRLRTATAPKSARFDWGDGETRVNAGFVAKGDAKSTVGLIHERLGDADEAQRMKAFWRERLATMREVLAH